MNTLKLLVIYSLTIYATTQTMDDISHKSKKPNVLDNALIGAVAGTAAMITNQPLIYFKNTLQRGTAIEWLKPKIWYRGLGMNISAIGPTTAIQTATNAALELVMTENTMSAMFMRAFLAGVASATLCAPIELIILDQQKKNGSIPQTVKRLTAESGWQVFVRGWSATALREGPWSIAYLVGFPVIQEIIKKQIDDPIAASVGGYIGAGAITGSAVALVTHPVDTVKTYMQNDYQAIETKKMSDAIRTIYTTRGINGFFSGVAPRSIHCGLSIALISTLTMYLSNKITECEKE